jgi:tRNA threonylcarbamoyladenosine biosynthesis protein TsaB
MNNKRPVLAVETSSDLCSVAILSGGDNYFSLNIRQKHIHSEKLISMIRTILEYAGMKISDPEYIAISMGPGSFTGLRIGLSAVKGVAIGASLPICPVPTFDAFAFEVSRYMKEEETFTIARNVNVDELYAAKYVVENRSYKVLKELDIIKKSSFDTYVNEKDLVFGNYPVGKKEPADIDAAAIARWASVFGENLITDKFDFLEPDYIKKFEGRKI